MFSRPIPTCARAYHHFLMDKLVVRCFTVTSSIFNPPSLDTYLISEEQKLFSFFFNLCPLVPYIYIYLFISYIYVGIVGWTLAERP